ELLQRLVALAVGEHEGGRLAVRQGVEHGLEVQRRHRGVGHHEHGRRCRQDPAEYLRLPQKIAADEDRVRTCPEVDDQLTHVSPSLLQISSTESRTECAEVSTTTSAISW